MLVLGGGVACRSFTEGAGVVAVFPEGDGWSSVACTKCDDGRCWGELGNLDTGVKEEKPAIRAGGLACVEWAGVQTAWAADNQVYVLCNRCGWAESFCLGSLDC